MAPQGTGGVKVGGRGDDVTTVIFEVGLEVKVRRYECRGGTVTDQVGKVVLLRSRSNLGKSDGTKEIVTGRKKSSTPTSTSTLIDTLLILVCLLGEGFLLV